VFSTRQIISQAVTNRDDRLRTTVEAICDAKSRIKDILHKGLIRRDDDVLRVRSFLHVLRLFEVEILCHLKDWNHLLDVVGEVATADALVANTFEAIADILVCATCFSVSFSVNLNLVCITVGREGLSNKDPVHGTRGNSCLAGFSRFD